MRKYYQLILVIVCAISVVALLIYRHQYNHLRYVLEVLNFFGKPGGSVEENTCTYGINSTFLSEKLENRRADALDMPPQFQRIDEYHYAYSSFWRKYNAHFDLNVQSQYFGVSDTLVLGSKLAKQNFRCHFLLEDEDRPIIGKFSFSRLDSKANIKETKKYVLFIFHCKLTRPLGSPYGVSFYSNSDTNPIYSPIIRMVDIDKKSVLYKNGKVETKVSFENNFKIAACVMPNMLPIIKKRDVIEFLSFHKMIGISEFHVYDNSLSLNILERLQILPVEIIGFTIYILPFNFPFSSEDTYHVMRDLAELHCTFRNLNRNRKFEEKDINSKERISHIVNLAWDEFIVPRYHYLLKPFLSRYEMSKSTIKLQLPTLHFCLNQRNDPKVKPDYPNIVKKTHYDKSVTSERPFYIYNLGSMNENDVAIQSISLQSDSNTKNIQKTEKMSQEIIAIHKYIDCKENGSNRGFRNIDMDFSDFENRPHQFEGAMIRFGEDLFNTQLYVLFRTGKIWSPAKNKQAN